MKKNSIISTPKIVDGRTTWDIIFLNVGWLLYGFHIRLIEYNSMDLTGII